MYVSPSCYKVQRFFKHYVTEDDVGNIETCRNVLKNHDLLSAVSTFWYYYIPYAFIIPYIYPSRSYCHLCLKNYLVKFWLLESCLYNMPIKLVVISLDIVNYHNMTPINIKRVDRFLNIQNIGV